MPKEICPKERVEDLAVLLQYSNIFEENDKFLFFFIYLLVEIQPKYIEKLLPKEICPIQLIFRHK